MTDHIPQSPDIERAVLGAMLLDKRAIETTVEAVDETAFYKPAHAMVFEAVRSLYNLNEPVDQLTIAELLKEQKRLIEVGGEAFIAGLAAETRSTANVRHHCQILLEKAQLRQTITLAQQLMGQASSEDTAPSDLLLRAGHDIERIIGAARAKTYKPLANIIPDSYRLIEERANSTTGLTGITTGFSFLNRWTGGWQNGDFIIVAALPSCGKTTLGINHALAAAKAGHPTGVFSIEMTDEKLGERLIADKSGVPVFQLHYQKPSQSDWAAMSNSAAWLSEQPLYIDDTSALNINELTIRAKRMRRERAIELAMIDYLQLMSGMKERERRHEIDAISRGLKSLAKSTNIPVIAIAQLNRNPAKENRRPEKYDLKESGQLEQDADVIIFIWDPPVDTKKVMADAQQINIIGENIQNLRSIYVAKQRNGPLAERLVRWRQELFRFEEIG